MFLYRPAVPKFHEASRINQVPILAEMRCYFVHFWQGSSSGLHCWKLYRCSNSLSCCNRRLRLYRSLLTLYKIGLIAEFNSIVTCPNHKIYLISSAPINLKPVHQSKKRSRCTTSKGERHKEKKIPFKISIRAIWFRDRNIMAVVCLCRACPEWKIFDRAVSVEKLAMHDNRNNDS